ncbi:nitric oxide synthase, partial [Plakobranchus ocellatus]
MERSRKDNIRWHEIINSGGTESEKGVGIIVEQTVTKAIKGYWALSDRVLLVKIAGKPVDLNIIQVYALTANSNDEDLDKFYNELDTAKTQCKSQDPLIIMGDFNAKVDTEKVDDIVEKHGLGIRNELGEKLIKWCETNNIIVGNTWFQQPPRRKWTWKSPGGAGPIHEGVCSGWLNKCPPGTTVPCMVRAAPTFHLPEDRELPVIMVGPGTGIAPFRSFWQQRSIDMEMLSTPSEEDKTTVFGPLTMYFGCRSSTQDNIYSDELQEYHKKSVLTQFHVALSREPNMPK